VAEGMASSAFGGGDRDGGGGARRRLGRPGSRLDFGRRSWSAWGGAVGTATAELVGGGKDRSRDVCVGGAGGRRGGPRPRRKGRRSTSAADIAGAALGGGGGDDGRNEDGGGAVGRRGGPREEMRERSSAAGAVVATTAVATREAAGPAVGEGGPERNGENGAGERGWSGLRRPSRHRWG